MADQTDPMASGTLAATLAAFNRQPVVDMHTHLYAPAFGHSGTGPNGGGDFLLWGIDELLCYHYFTDEVLRVVDPSEITAEPYLAMPKSERADLVWRELFRRRTPVSEACTGVIETLIALGLDPDDDDLGGYRRWFKERDANDHVDEVMRLAGVERITMTNELFKPDERALWETSGDSLRDPRFSAVARMDTLLIDWPAAARELSGMGFDVREDGSGETSAEVRRFLLDWITKTDAVYMACSLPPTFRYPSESDRLQTRLIDEAIVPAANEAGIPLALMIGAKRAVNPVMGQAGDGLGESDVDSLCNLARTHSGTTLLVTYLSRENQHELCIAARKFRNIVPFGCWWFVNTTSMIEEITRERLELLGTSFIPQHSDARVLEQLIYKWRHSRRVIAGCVAERYDALAGVGMPVGQSRIESDADRLLRSNYLAAIDRGVSTGATA